jgi:hypothetical protein
MLGDSPGAFKFRPAFLATILVGRHGLNPAKEAPAVEGTIYGRQLIWGRCPAEAMAFKHRYDHIQRLAMPEDARPSL